MKRTGHTTRALFAERNGRARVARLHSRGDAFALLAGDLLSRESVLALGAVMLVVVGGLWGMSAYEDHQTEIRSERRETRREERRAAGREQLLELREESRALMPTLLDGVALGTSLEEVRALRGAAMIPDDRPAEEGIQQWHERLSNGGEVMYGFEERLGLLLQVQVLSLLPDVNAIAPHLRAMNEAYGSPTGIWDCPRTGDVPTRRFTWRRAETAVSDIFLIVGERVSLTLYITTSDRTAHSLARAGCTPITPDALDVFPVADHVPTDDAAPL